MSAAKQINAVKPSIATDSIADKPAMASLLLIVCQSRKGSLYVE
jgi:hypothetical protein